MHSHDFDRFAHFEQYEDDLDQRAARPRRRPRFDDDPQPNRSGRLTEQERVRLARARDEALTDDLPPGADRWSTWDGAEHGPRPYPGWLVTANAAADSELGVLKTGKEADVHLIRRAIPDTDGCLLAAKRYRSSEHRQFHRDAGYLEGRRMRRTREMRAIANRTTFGRNLIAEQWAAAEFGALSTLWSAGAPVPYPAQRDGTELLMEFLCDEEGTAAPRLSELRPNADDLHDLWHQLTGALELLAERGLTHGDLSAFNILVHNGRLMLIDLPQVVDLVANPSGLDFLARDVANITRWFRARGLPESTADPDALTAELVAVAGL